MIELSIKFNSMLCTFVAVYIFWLKFQTDNFLPTIRRIFFFFKRGHCCSPYHSLWEFFLYKIRRLCSPLKVRRQCVRACVRIEFYYLNFGVRKFADLLQFLNSNSVTAGLHIYGICLSTNISRYPYRTGDGQLDIKIFKVKVMRLLVKILLLQRHLVLSVY